MLKELINENNIDIVPAGYMTTEQWAAQENESLGQIGNYLRKGVALGLIEMKKYRIKLATCVRPVPHYRIIETKKKR